MHFLKLNCIVGTLLLAGACGSSKSDSNAKEGETATNVAATTEVKNPAPPSTPAAKPEDKTVEANGAAKAETVVPADLSEGKKEGQLKGTTLEAQKGSEEVSMDTKTSYCYLNNVFEDKGKTHITVDYIQIKEGKEEGYEEINNNKKLRTFILNSTTTLLPPGDLDVERLKRVLKTQTKQNSENADEDAFYQRFQITVKDGFVTELLIDMAG